MKFNKSISAVIIGLSLSMMTANPVQWVDRIVVVVNNDVITQRDIEDISTRIARSLPKNEAGKVSAMDIEKMAEFIDKHWSLGFFMSIFHTETN